MLRYLLREGIRINKIQFLWIIFITTCIFLLVNSLTMFNAVFSNNSTAYATSTNHRFVDIEYGQEYEPFYAKEGGELPVKAMHNKLSSAQDFEYFENYNQFLYLFDFQGSNIFREEYENGDPYSEDNLIELDGIKYPPAATIKAVQVSLNSFPNLNMKVIQGRNFREEDYKYHINEAVPVILGYEYKDIYSVGSKIQGIYIAEPFMFEVIGFLDKDSFIQTLNNILYMDRYIIMPSFQCETPVNIKDRIFQIRHYGLKTSGIIKLPPNMNEYELKNRVNKMASESGLKPYKMYSLDNSSSSVLPSDKFVLYISIICGFVIVLAAIFIILSVNKNILQSKDRYWAYIVSGASIQTIKRSIQIEIFFIVAVSCSLAIVIQSWFMMFSKSNITQPAGVACVVWLASAYTIEYTFLNKLLTQNLKEDGLR